MIESAVTELTAVVGTSGACAAVGRHRATHYRRLNPRQKRLGAELGAAGADIVIGHHPHIPQRITVDEGVPVCYSLGNGPLGTPGRFHSGRPPYGLVVSFDLDCLAAPRRMAVTLIHVDNAQVSFQPRVADGPDAERMLRKVLPKQLQWRDEPGRGMVADLDSSGVPIADGSIAAD